MKVLFWGTVVWLLCLMLCLSGCEGTTPVVFPDFPSGGERGDSEVGDTITEYENVECVCELIPLTLPSGRETFLNKVVPQTCRAAVYDEKIVLYTYAQRDRMGYLDVYTAAGKHAGEYLAHTDTSGLLYKSLSQIYDEANREILSFEIDQNRRVNTVVRNDAQGKVIGEVAAIPYQQSGYAVFMAIDESLYMYTHCNEDNRIFFLDRDFVLSGPFMPTAPVTTALRLDDGRVIVVCENGECMLYDEEKKTLTDIRLYEETEAWSKASQVLYGEDGGVYFVNADGITVQRGGEDTFICDFSKSYLSPDALQFVDVLSEDRFLVWYDNPLTGEDYPAILAPTDATERPMRQLVRVASIGTDEFMGQDYDRAKMIDASVAHFNMTNDEYFIELTNFDKLARTDKNGNTVPGDTTSIRDKLFEEALLAGEQYDVYLIGESYKDRDMLVEKGLFEDMTKFAERKRLIRCVRDAMTQNGKITGIPFSVELSTLVTSTDILPAGTPFTYDKLIEIYENLEDGQSLFCDYTGREMRQSAMYDFIDFDNKTCSFDSAEFAEVFGFLSDYEAAAFDGKTLTYTPTGYMNRAVGSFSGHPQGVTACGDIMDAFAKGDIKFLQLHIGAPDTLSSMLYFFDMLGKDYNLCGYPSAAGGTITVSAPMLMSVGADCENRSGAYDYLSLLLSDLLQTQDAMYAFPVTESAVQTRLS
ncbi:MAG: extracellular solute-binding protein, partial [Clostridia bacterium]|nr:extracellular solute-binding protein [Clostridia bacterium]